MLSLYIVASICTITVTSDSTRDPIHRMLKLNLHIKPKYDLSTGLPSGSRKGAGNLVLNYTNQFRNILRGQKCNSHSFT